MLNKNGSGLIGLLITSLIIIFVMMFALKSLKGKKNPGDDVTKTAPMGAVQKANDASAISEIATIKSALQVYRLDNDGANPSSLDELVNDNYVSLANITDNSGKKYGYNPATGEVSR